MYIHPSPPSNSTVQSKKGKTRNKFEYLYDEREGKKQNSSPSIEQSKKKKRIGKGKGEKRGGGKESVSIHLSRAVPERPCIRGLGGSKRGEREVGGGGVEMKVEVEVEVEVEVGGGGRGENS